MLVCIVCYHHISSDVEKQVEEWHKLVKHNMEGIMEPCGAASALLQKEHHAFLPRLLMLLNRWQGMDVDVPAAAAEASGTSAAAPTSEAQASGQAPETAGTTAAPAPESKPAVEDVFRKLPKCFLAFLSSLSPGTISVSHDCSGLQHAASSCL